MRENDIIAAFVRYKYPELIKGADFQFFKLGLVLKEAFAAARKSLESIDFTKLKARLDESEQKCRREERENESGN